MLLIVLLAEAALNRIDGYNWTAPLLVTTTTSGCLAGWLAEAHWACSTGTVARDSGPTHTHTHTHTSRIYLCQREQAGRLEKMIAAHCSHNGHILDTHVACLPHTSSYSSPSPSHAARFKPLVELCPAARASSIHRCCSSRSSSSRQR